MAPGERPTPKLAVWEFTLACDQKCVACGPRAGRARPGELTTDEALKLVDELAELGVGEVDLIVAEGRSQQGPEYWIVNLVARCITVHREPGAAEYAIRETRGGHDAIELPRGVRCSVNDVLF